MELEKPKFFIDTKSFMVFAIIMGLVVVVRLGISYSNYIAFVQKPFYYTEADVLQSYLKQKSNKTYTVLKLQSKEGWIFYTTTPVIESFDGYRLRIMVFPSNEVSFWAYLGNFYLKSRIKKKTKISQTFKNKVLQHIESQHPDKKIASFYNAIFFAQTIDQSFRDAISRLGANHIIALSGFHLGILWLVIYRLLWLVYAPLQQRYFPYRFALLDVGAVVIVFLAWYVWFVDAPPSLIRSYGMVLIGWMIVLSGVALINFGFLYSVVMFLLALLPNLLVSYAFWLSVAGVHSIFLLLKYAQSVDKLTIALLIIPIGAFVLMLPIVHGLFGVTTPYQLLSIILSLLFAPFYLLTIALHAIGNGEATDFALAWLMRLPQGEVSEQMLSVYSVGIYVAFAFWAIVSRRVFVLLLTMAVGYGIFLYV